MKQMQEEPYKLIETNEQLLQFKRENESVTWIAFDTEFIGEKRYFPLLCWLQIVTEKGIYLIDSVQLPNIQPVLDLIQNDSILKITHAGENDYLVLYTLHGIVPKNIFDMQIAAGFLGLGYPSSFQKMVQKFLGILLDKNHTVSDWKQRPISKQQIQYALNDVIYLRPLFEELCKRLREHGRLAWVQEECAKWERPDFYLHTPAMEALDNPTASTLNPQQQTLLIRLYEWRDREAREKNLPKETILPANTLSTIVKLIVAGRKVVSGDRRIPDRVIEKYWNTFIQLFHQKISPSEREILQQINAPSQDNSDNPLLDMLYLILKYKSEQEGISPILMLPRADYNRMKKDKDFFPKYLQHGWRVDLLGRDFVKWLEKRNGLSLTLDGSKCIIEMQDI